MPPVVQQPEWVQYGSFGLIAFLVIIGLPAAVWVAVGFIKGITASFEKAIDRVCCTFKEESAECREERKHVQESATEEREKDRVARHELRNAVQALAASLHQTNNRPQ
jgi:hypothetical protein